MTPLFFRTPADEARYREHEIKLRAWRIENRRQQGLPPLPPYVAPVPAVASSKPTAVATPRKSVPTISDEAFERMRAAIEGRAPAAQPSTRNTDEAAAAAILDAFRTFEPATANKRPSAGPVTSEDEAAVAAIMTAFRTLLPSR